MTIFYTMTLVGLLGLALHFELYWVAAGIVALFVLSSWLGRKKKQ